MFFAICEDDPYFSTNLQKMLSSYLKNRNLDAVHYILKPVREEKLTQALDRALERRKSRGEKAVWFSNGDRAVKIPLGDIRYCDVRIPKECALEEMDLCISGKGGIIFPLSAYISTIME